MNAEGTVLNGGHGAKESAGQGQLEGPVAISHGSAAVVLAVVAPRLAGLYSMHIFDDAFITFRYAENLARGHGLVYNQGLHTLGTTTPLFAVLLALPSLLGLDALIGALVIGILSDAVTGVVIYRALGKELGRQYALAAVALFSVDPHILRVSVGGMESSLFVALSALIIHLLAEGRPRWAFMAASISVYVRPEGGILWLGCIWYLWRRSFNERASRLAIAIGLTLTVIPAAFLYAYYGTILPQSVIAKGDAAGRDLWDVLRVFFFPPESPLQSLLTVVAPVGLLAAWQRSSFVRITALWVGVYILAYCLARPVMWTWYGLPVYAAKAVFSGIAVAHALRRYAGTAHARWSYSPSWCVALSIGAAIALAVIAGPSPVKRNVYEPLRAWCRENVKEGETIAAGDIGAVGYYSHAFIYDLAGLVWPEKRQYRNHLDIIEAKRPDYILAELAGYWEVLFDPHSIRLRDYRPVVRFSRYGKKEIPVAPAEWAGGWQQDYVMFKRRQSEGRDGSRLRVPD